MFDFYFYILFHFIYHLFKTEQYCYYIDTIIIIILDHADYTINTYYMSIFYIQTSCINRLLPGKNGQNIKYGAIYVCTYVLD